MKQVTIQDKIDKKADIALQTELCRVFSQFRKDSGIQLLDWIQLLGSNNALIKVQANKLLDQLQKHIFAKLQPGYRSKETERFLNELDELRHPPDKGEG